MSDAEAIKVLLRVAHRWLTSFPQDNIVAQAVVTLEAPVPNNRSGCMVCGCMPCMCPGGRPEFGPREWMR